MLLNNGPEFDKHNSYSDICVLNAKDLWEPETAIKKLTNPYPDEWRMLLRESRGLAVFGVCIAIVGIGLQLVPGPDPYHVGASLCALMALGGLAAVVAGGLKWLQARRKRAIQQHKIPFTVEVVDRTDAYWQILTAMTRQWPSWSEVKAEILSDSDPGKLLLALLLQELTATAQVRAQLRAENDGLLSEDQRNGHLEDLKERADQFYELLGNVIEDFKVYGEDKERQRNLLQQLASAARLGSNSEATQHAFEHLPPVAVLNTY